MSERRALAASSVAEVSRARNLRSPSIGPAAPAPCAADTDRILASFNTWSFKREQPDDLPSLRRAIADAVAIAAPLSFVLYWGKGPRCRIGQPDIECLDYLASLTRRVDEVYAHGATVTLIFTDTHAELNGHSPEGMGRYFGEVEVAARRHGFDGCRLGALMRAAGPSAQMPVDDAPPDLLAQLLPSARKWYRGDASHEEAALAYYRMNMAEARAVERAFPRAIFITFNGSKLRGLFPESLPIFFMYALRRGVGIKPWFLPQDATPCSDAICRCEVAQPQGG
jgi:hypothetical protein